MDTSMGISMDSANDEKPNTKVEIQNPLLNYVNDLTRTQSTNGARAARLRGKASFRQRAKKVQNAAALTKLFNEKGAKKSTNKWRLLLQK